MKRIRVAIADDEKLIREGFKIIFSTYSDIEVVGLCSDGEQAYKLCCQRDVDVFLMDIRMPICDGVQGTKLIKDTYPSVKVLILTTFNDDEYIFDALNNGASGYLLKDTSYNVIIDAVRSAYNGNIVMHPDVAAKVIKNGENPPKQYDGDLKEKYQLTQREIEIIKEVSQGLSNKEISEKLYLTEGTIKNHITEILSKLSLRDRTQIAIFAFKNSIVK